MSLALLRTLLTQLYILAVFRVGGLVIYPVAYLLRHWLRKSYAETYSKQYYTRHRWRWLWYYLDDSIHIDSRDYCTDRVDYNITPNGSGSQEYTGQSFWKSYKWSQLRNAGVNWRNYNLKGMCIKLPTDKDNYCGIYPFSDGKKYFSCKKYFRLFGKTIKLRFSYTLGDSPIDGRFEDLTIRTWSK